MTFGEHLEELRIALAKASIWLGVGLLIGLPMASSVVRYMQGPLEASLEKFYRKQSESEMAKALNLDSVSQDLSEWMKEKKVASQMMWVDPRRLRHQDSSDAEILRNADSEGLPDPVKLMQLRLFVPIDANTEALGLQEPFMIWLKAALVVAVVVASPGIFFHLWQFIAAGLYPHERRYVYFFLPVSLLLFWAGAALAFFVIFRLVIDFLLEFNSSMGIGASPRLTDYMSFALFLPLGFGISFQLPLVMLVLERLGLVSVQTYLSQWRVAILVIAFISMILTPAEISSMVGMAVPLIALYFLGIAMCHYLPRSNMQHSLPRDTR
jgi:sec-independent protein translocase protein TatC